MNAACRDTRQPHNKHAPLHPLVASLMRRFRFSLAEATHAMQLISSRKLKCN